MVTSEISRSFASLPGGLLPRRARRIAPGGTPSGYGGLVLGRRSYPDRQQHRTPGCVWLRPRSSPPARRAHQRLLSAGRPRPPDPITATRIACINYAPRSRVSSPSPGASTGNRDRDARVSGTVAVAIRTLAGFRSPAELGTLESCPSSAPTGGMRKRAGCRYVRRRARRNGLVSLLPQTPGTGSFGRWLKPELAS
jgi:hypothetical protein